MKSGLKILLLLLAVHYGSFGFAQDATALINKVKAKIDKVNDYTAKGVLKTDVAFIKAPVSNVIVYFKKPNRFRLIKKGGISILPKGGVSVNMGTIIGTDNFTALDAGEAIINSIKTKVVKLLPGDDNSNIVLSTLYIDEAKLLIVKAITTTRENGTYELSMKYGKYADYSLPDKIDFSFNTKEYKLPKGVTLNFNENPSSEKEKLKNKKGSIEISYASYIINKGINDAVFLQ
ncbi:LolA family protein [Parafilimonas sp.]|uniref:LolA family protein n=1 Tax=Parafilimonas sp. TaxID=1969739 RepID=UPI003F7D9D27